MTPIFILQLICCTVTVMLAVQLAMASLQVRWKVRRYEVSRWLLCGAMSVLSIHYMLQMTQGLRAQGADVGAVFNILFYTPIFFTTTLSIINMESKRTIVRRYCLRCTIAYICILFIFAFGVITLQSLHLGNLLYVMLGFFIASMAYFIYATHHEILKRKKRMLEVSGGDLIPYVRYAQASITLLCLTAAFLPIAILFNTLLLYVGPLMLLTIVFFIHSFISLGYYMTPKEDIMSIQYESGDKGTRVEYTEGDGNLKESDILSSDERDRTSHQQMVREGTVQGLRRYYLFAVCQSRLSEERGDRILQRVRTHKLPYMAQRPTLQRGYPNDEGFPEIQQRCHLHRVWFLVTHTDLSYIQAKNRYVAKSMAQAVCFGLRVFLLSHLSQKVVKIELHS